MSRKPVHKLEDLDVYQVAMKLYEDFVQIDARQLLKHPLGRDLARQQLRSLDSICANIEEGFSRKKGKEFKQFLRVAHGSARESKGRFQRLGFLLGADSNGRTQETDRLCAMLYRLIQKIGDS